MSFGFWRLPASIRVQRFCGHLCLRLFSGFCVDGAAVRTNPRSNSSIVSVGEDYACLLWNSKATMGAVTWDSCGKELQLSAGRGVYPPFSVSLFYTLGACMATSQIQCLPPCWSQAPLLWEHRKTMKHSVHYLEFLQLQMWVDPWGPQRIYSTVCFLCG